jgi:hypothetical protein
MLLSGYLLNKQIHSNKKVYDCVNCPKCTGCYNNPQCKRIEDYKENEKNSISIFLLIIVMIIEISLLIYAVKLATSCNPVNQFQRIVNLLLALSSPVLYIILRLSLNADCL